MSTRIVRAIVLMSGTSLDGIDAALIETDGLAQVRTGPWLTVPYDETMRTQLRGVAGGRGDVSAADWSFTMALSAAAAKLREQHRIDHVDVIGSHGHTILHRPRDGNTWQIGNGKLLAELAHVDVVCDFRANDVANGGEGAPLAPLFHAALAANLPRPLAVLNIGGVANVTWIGERPDDILAFDTGPGNALIDDWSLRHTGKRAADYFPAPATRWLVTGGGRHNPVLMTGLERALGVSVAPVENVGWQGDALEAQAFAYLAVRSLAGLPLSLPATTGVSRPMTGGRLFRAG